MPPADRTQSRRTMLGTTIGAVAATGLAGVCTPEAKAADEDTHPWIDAHSHIWTTDLKAYPLRDNQPIDVLQPQQTHTALADACKGFRHCRS